MALRRLLLSAVALSCASAGVVELTDENFEHDTQVSTGATTGPWFVKFYAPWCGHCKKLAPVWDELAAALEGEVNVAKSDVTVHQGLKNRFEVRGFPTLKFFSGGRMYGYDGARDLAALTAFAKGGFKEKESVAAPGEPTIVDMVKRELKVVYRQLVSKKDRESKVMVFTLGLVIGATLASVLCCVCFMGGGGAAAPPKQKAA